MWRRIPIVPMLFGACGALAILSIFSLGEPLLIGWRPYLSAAAIGAAYVLALYALVVAIRVPRTAIGAAGCGFFYAAAGYFFLLIIVLVGAIAVTQASVQIRGAAAFASLLGFVGLGILSGLMLARFRRVEAERQRAALERQQLELARNLQQSLLPPSLLETDRYRVSARNVPAQYIAGDFYDFVPLSDGRLLVVLADVAGKGVGAGLIMATVKAMIPLLAAEQPNPAPLLGRLNERLTGQLPPREFVAVTLALYDAERGTVTIANGGLPDPLLVASSQPVIVGGARYPIGVRKNLLYESLTLRLPKGMKLILFSDGLPEATVNGEPIGYEKFGAEVQRSAGDIERLFASLEKIGAAHDDDWTAVVLEAR